MWLQFYSDSGKNFPYPWYNPNQEQTSPRLQLTGKDNSSTKGVCCLVSRSAISSSPRPDSSHEGDTLISYEEPQPSV